MITFQIAGYLTEFAGGEAEIKIDATPATVRDALNQLWNRHVGLRDRVLTEQGAVRQHVNIFVNNNVGRREDVLSMPLKGDVEICIMPAVSGGADRSAIAFVKELR
jgi:sulfur-carrier protein